MLVGNDDVFYKVVMVKVFLIIVIGEKRKCNILIVNRVFFCVLVII